MLGNCLDEAFYTCDTWVYSASQICLFRVIRVLSHHVWCVLWAQVTKECAWPSESTSHLFPVLWFLCITSVNKYPRVWPQFPLPSSVSTWPSLHRPGPAPAPPAATVPAHEGCSVAAVRADNWSLISASWSQHQGDAELDVTELLHQEFPEPLGPAHQGQEASHSCCLWLRCECPPTSPSEVFREPCLCM